MIWWQRPAAAVWAAVLLAAITAATPASAAVAASTPSCAPASLKVAEPLRDDVGRDGSPVKVTAMADGTSIPVVFVHGWTGRSEHTPQREGAFSHIIDLMANRAGKASVGRSLIGQLQDAGGTTVYTFDYHDLSARWVTDPGIGKPLADALSCVATVHGHPAVVVAHSMGGLATREALSLLKTSGTSISSIVSDVVTYGTPNDGSWVASVVDAGTTAAAIASYIPGATGKVIAAVQGLLVTCGAVTTSSLTNTGMCGLLPSFLSSARSEAGKALRIGSPEGKALAPWPKEVTVHALAGSADLEFARIRWFGLGSTSLGSAQVGDFIVGTESAYGGAALSQNVSCRYTLDEAGSRDDKMAYLWQLKTANEVRESVSGIQDSACFHGNLMRTVELTNTALGVVADRVDELNVEADIPAELRGEWCTRVPAEDNSVTVQPHGDGFCFSLAGIADEFPDWFIDGYGPDDFVEGAKQMHICLINDLDDSCTTAASMYLVYYPAGVAFDCNALWGPDWPCEPDYTWAHETDKPRLAIVPNHQQDVVYHDVPPMYRLP